MKFLKWGWKDFLGGLHFWTTSPRTHAHLFTTKYNKFQHVYPLYVEPLAISLPPFFIWVIPVLARLRVPFSIPFCNASLLGVVCVRGKVCQKVFSAITFTTFEPESFLGGGNWNCAMEFPLFSSLFPSRDDCRVFCPFPWIILLLSYL